MGFVENFLYMLDRQGEEQEYRSHPVLVEAMEKLFIIHAEHELNCSCSTLRHIASTLCDPFSAVAGAAAALYGPLHGGANEAVLEMLEEIGTLENVPIFLESVKRKEKKLMGFGHRVYKNYDPRAAIIKDLSERVFEVCGKEPLIGVAIALEQAALSDSYFIERKLYPNVDYYSGLIYRAMGFPTDFFPLLFAIPRIAGWLAHWREALMEQGRIWRPRQIYVGHLDRRFVTIDQRADNCNVDNGVSSMYKRYVVSTKDEEKG
jgi:citrate synthase